MLRKSNKTFIYACGESIMNQYTRWVKASTGSDRSDQDSKQSKLQKGQVILQFQVESIVLPNQ